MSTALKIGCQPLENTNRRGMQAIFASPTARSGLEVRREKAAQSESVQDYLPFTVLEGVKNAAMSHINPCEGLAWKNSAAPGSRSMPGLPAPTPTTEDEIKQAHHRASREQNPAIA